MTTCPSWSKRSGGCCPTTGRRRPSPAPPGRARVAGFCAGHAYERPVPTALPAGWHLALLDGWCWQAEDYPPEVAVLQAELAAGGGPCPCESCPEQARFVWVFMDRYQMLRPTMRCKRCSADEDNLGYHPMAFRWVETEQRWYHATTDLALGEHWRPRPLPA